MLTFLKIKRLRNYVNFEYFLYKAHFKQEHDVTQDVQICSSADRGGATAPEGGFAFVVAAVTDQRTADGQTAAKVPEASVHQHSIFPPCNAELNERPGGRERNTDKHKRGMRDRSGLKETNKQHCVLIV